MVCHTSAQRRALCSVGRRGREITLVSTNPFGASLAVATPLVEASLSVKTR